ncbi:hypothetical protein [Sedimentitalea sp.]|uniref:hypothetical protein n=1 Tax=Sedimentitalea sp. TaxID=2048915 RepID=UPI0032971940
MRTFFKRVTLLILTLVAVLMLPVGYIELACRPSGETEDYVAILPPEHRRAEGRTLLTYPEWHIVHAYEDYARVIRDGDPHDYSYLSSIAGFWTSLCSLSKASGPHGGFPSASKQTIYTIGVSFTAELLAKAAYEEALGRVATWIRGGPHAPLDDLSAEQATRYSQFLRQKPWYLWDFTGDANALSDGATDAFRDRERLLALGLEYKVKASYANVIAAAVANMEPDALRFRMIVTGLNAEGLGRYRDVEVIAQRDEGIEIDTPRYRALTEVLLGYCQVVGVILCFVDSGWIMRPFQRCNRPRG